MKLGELSSVVTCSGSDASGGDGDLDSIRNPYSPVWAPAASSIGVSKPPGAMSARAILYTNLATVHLLRGDRKQATQYVEQALSLQPDSRQALLCLVYLELQSGEDPCLNLCLLHSAPRTQYSAPAFISVPLAPCLHPCHLPPAFTPAPCHHPCPLPSPLPPAPYLHPLPPAFTFAACPLPLLHTQPPYSIPSPPQGTPRGQSTSSRSNAIPQDRLRPRSTSSRSNAIPTYSRRLSHAGVDTLLCMCRPPSPLAIDAVASSSRVAQGRLLPAGRHKCPTETFKRTPPGHAGGCASNWPIPFHSGITPSLSPCGVIDLPRQPAPFDGPS